jgi:predicted secreted acid phosphatase
VLNELNLMSRKSILMKERKRKEENDRKKSMMKVKKEIYMKVWDNVV